jgi:hypothetical protein
VVVRSKVQALPLQKNSSQEKFLRPKEKTEGVPRNRS